MQLRKVLFIVIVLGGLAVAPAEAVTVRDIIELSRAGLSDEVLVALVEADNSLFSLDAPQILALRAAGVSERVIVAMLRSGRQADAARSAVPPAATAEPAPPQVVVIEHREERAAAPAVVVTLPVAVPVPVAVVPVDINRQILHGSVSPLGRAGFGRFFNDGFIEHSPPPSPLEHRLWGWGGKLRPGAWKPKPSPGSK